MRLLLFLLVLAFSLGAESIPITGTINEALPGQYFADLSGPGFSFDMGIGPGCAGCGDPGVGDCTPGAVCGFKYGWGLSYTADEALLFMANYDATYHGISVNPLVTSSSEMGTFSLSSTGVLYTGQGTLTEPLTVSGQVEASIGDQEFLDLFITGSGTVQAFFVGSASTDPNTVYGLDASFTGTASTSSVPEPKNVALVILSMAVVVAFLKRYGSLPGRIRRLSLSAPPQ